ncbi:BON domain-containing protein [Rhizobium sp. PL01]|uniref:BON domain-containing protein n=1 Tax=Rhizobium sp. PL01 TaxID=3085631 RepID=UPI002981B692|nr:BON domain-containing protein [Rhizobium sp. PL01]MDW5318482.1 BON domain-containing protein [Rhizobium sp. PL01]
MTGHFIFNHHRLGAPAPFALSLKASFLSALSAETDFETWAVRVSMFDDYLVLEGYVSDAANIGKVVALAESFAGIGRVRNFLFQWS